MKLTLLVLSALVFGLIAIACTETASPTNSAAPRTTAASPAPSAAAPADEFARAKTNYAKNCEACHGPKAEGGLAKVDNKQIKVPSLKSDHAIKHPDDKLVKTITNGQEDMPAFKDKLSADEINELVR